MKKRLFIVLFLLLFPAFVSALEVDKVSISSNDKVSINKEIKVSFNISYSGISTKNKSGYGIGGYTYQLDFDDSIFVPVSIEKNDFFNTNIYKDENNKYHVIGTIKKDNKSNNKCVDKILYCSSIKDVITFSVKSTTEKKSTIKIFASNTYFYKINSELSNSNRKIIDSSKTSSKKITIESSSFKSSEPTSIAKKIKTKNIETTIENKILDYKNGTDSQGNNYLSDLTVEGYEIEFDKHLLTYDVNISKDVNSLDIEAITESEDATIEIIGNDDLKSNNYVVEIIVTALDQTKKTYKINTIFEKVEEEKEKIETEEDIKELVSSIKKKFDDKLIKKIEIGAVCLLGLIAFIIAVKSITNKKLNKKLKDFDDL